MQLNILVEKNIIDDYLSGTTLKKTEASYNVTEYIIYAVLSIYGIKKRGRVIGKPPLIDPFIIRPTRKAIIESRSNALKLIFQNYGIRSAKKARQEI